MNQKTEARRFVIVGRTKRGRNWFTPMNAAGWTSSRAEAATLTRAEAEGIAPTLPRAVGDRAPEIVEA
mgnify:FL=1